MYKKGLTLTVCLQGFGPVAEALDAVVVPKGNILTGTGFYTVFFQEPVGGARTVAITGNLGAFLSHIEGLMLGYQEAFLWLRHKCGVYLLEEIDTVVDGLGKAVRGESDSWDFAGEHPALREYLNSGHKSEEFRAFMAAGNVETVKTPEHPVGNETAVYVGFRKTDDEHVTFALTFHAIGDGFYELGAHDV